MNQGVIWEMDFNSLPLRDSNDKRVWELLVCDSTGTFKQSRYCSNQEVNSVWVSERLKEYLAIAPQSPIAIRVFRSRMSSILQRGCEMAGIPMRPSRRVFMLAEWMRERAEQVYPHEAQYTYKPDTTVAIEMDPPAPLPLPDTLQGERWALVTLRVAELQDADQWPTEFGELFPVDWSLLDTKTVVPGLLIASRRAVPLAGWMTGIEPAFLEVLGGSQPNLVLEVGQTDRYIMARLGDEKTRAEAEGFTTRKQQVQGIHFLAIQTDLKAQSFAGFWLLKDMGNLS